MSRGLAHLDEDDGRSRPVNARPPGGITGIYYHPSFSRRSYLTAGRRLAGFPAALGPLLQNPGVALSTCPRAGDELIRLAHDPGMIPEVEADPF